MTVPLYTGIKAVTTAILKTKNTNPALDKPLLLPSPSNGTYNTGIEEFEIEAVDQCTGEKFVADTYVVKRAPSFSLTYGAKSKELLSAFFGLKLENGTRDTAVAKTIEVTAGSYLGTISGFNGFGAAADQTASYAFYLTDNGTSAPLTRQPFATFNPATPLSWACGVNGAVKFSDDVVAARRFVTYYIPYSSTNTDFLSSTPQTNFSCDLFFLDTDQKVGHFIFPSVTSNLTENGEFEFSGGEIVLNFRVTGDVILRYPNRLASC